MPANMHEPVSPRAVLLGSNKGLKALYVGILFRLGDGFCFSYIFLFFSRIQGWKWIRQCILVWIWGGEFPNRAGHRLSLLFSVLETCNGGISWKSG